ncbi:MAG: TonB-dependent receptor [Bacteroidetes bacterium CG12_big_fil_rev_8_21_14_0_65_60_17]|nr:MAG: TonB-dependent receptor [Bacteroidetes bacterium CG12_big_fil_rev_8_21_14_0_65_60_17]
MRRIRFSATSIVLSALLLVLATHSAKAQEWGSVVGTITESDSGFPVPGASVVVNGTNFGTAADVDGRYELRLPMGRFVLRYSSVGFEAQLDTVDVEPRRIISRNVVLRESIASMDELTVEARAPLEAGVFEISPETVDDIPVPVRDALRALRILPGVSANNELSNQFSVRGGGFNENLFFVNGFEIFLPFRPRTGEQEGLSLVNSDMAERITLYTGGFPARYGGKLSSAVDVQYKRPQRTNDPFEMSGYASLLDYGVTGSGSTMGGRLGLMGSVRVAQARRFFQTQELQGEYQPQYLDGQVYAGYEISMGQEIEVLGMLASNDFELDPNSRKTFFGSLSQNSAVAPSNLQSLWVRFDADNQELDGYDTAFLGVRLSNRLTTNTRIEHDISFFDTAETEELDLSGTSLLFNVDPGADNPQDGDGLIQTGQSRQEEFADNSVEVQTITGQGRYMYSNNRHVSEAGWSVRRLDFDDRIDEKSVVVGQGLDGEVVRIVADSLRDTASFGAWQSSFHVQESYDAIGSDPGKLMITGGLRTDYYSFTGEWTVSPRASFTLRQSVNTTLFGSAGIYYQAPTYRELRGKPEVGETILGALNDDLKSQRSDQVIMGGEVFLPGRRVYVRGEAYYKRITNMISYDVENVRVRYSGENDASGRHYGLDLQLRGELVPGLESWLNYSYLVARERFDDEFVTPESRGLLARPTDQRHTISLFLQDYVPSDPTWKLHMRTLYGSGLPYTPPKPGPQIGNLITQAPGDRFSARYPRFFRFDIGASKTIGPEVTGSRLSMQLTAEILNLFDMTNTVSYSWVPDSAGIWQRVPTRLTPRLVNVRITADF